MKFIYLNLLILALFFNFIELKAEQNDLECGICTPKQNECYKKCFKRNTKPVELKNQYQRQSSRKYSLDTKCRKECNIVSPRFLNFNIYRANQNYYHNETPKNNMNSDYNMNNDYNTNQENMNQETIHKSYTRIYQSRP